MNKKGFVSVLLLVGILVIGFVSYFGYLRINPNDLSISQENPPMYQVSDDYPDNIDQGKVDDNRRREDIQALYGALQYYYTEHEGVYPQNLSDVIPDYLKQLPKDPKTQEEYTYIHSSKHFTLQAKLSDGTLYEKKDE
jgi:hypothetical protein